MFSAFINAFRVKELKRRMFFTMGIIVLCRIAANIPCPGVNTANLAKYFEKFSNESAAGSLLGMIDLFSGGALQQFAIGALGIMPYISASIVIQLLVPVLPQLDKLRREGEPGMNKINQYTRYLTILICIIQGAMASLAMMNPARLGLPSQLPGQPLVSMSQTSFVLLAVCILTCGTMIMMWFGERITEHGIGNGISLIITINIIERLPQAVSSLYEMVTTGLVNGGSGRFRLVNLFLLLLIFAVVTAATVALTQGTRRVPVQLAKQAMGGRQAMNGGMTYMPLKVNFPGVMPIIFAGAILMFPPIVLRFIPNQTVQGWAYYFRHESYSYMVFYGVLILAFSYFWVANMFNPLQISEHLKHDGAFIPGVRPGKSTADFLDGTMTRVTLIGAIFLTALAVFPMLLTKWLGVPYTVASFFGGTSLLIIVGVSIETLSQLESQLVMRNYEGFLKRGRLRSRKE